MREVHVSPRRPPQGWRLHALVACCFSFAHVLMLVAYIACSGVPEGSVHEAYTRSGMWQCPDQEAVRRYMQVGTAPAWAPAGPRQPCGGSLPSRHLTLRMLQGLRPSHCLRTLHMPCTATHTLGRQHSLLRVCRLC